VTADLPAVRPVEDPPRLVDARGLRCPWPVLRLARARRDGAAAVDLLTDDAIAAGEIAAFAAEHDLTVAAVPGGFRVAPR
jgi:tRNA 2-thiouridine synthesizing protein A